MTEFLYFCLLAHLLTGSWSTKHALVFAEKPWLPGDLKMGFPLPHMWRKQSDEKKKSSFLPKQSDHYYTPCWKGQGSVCEFLCYLLEIKMIAYEVTFKVIFIQHRNGYKNNVFRIHLQICFSSSVLYLLMEINSV